MKDPNIAEALDQQAATSAILGVISEMPTDLQPVFDTIARSAKRLCHARFCAVFQFDGTLLHLVAHYGIPSSGLEIYRREYPRPPGRENAIGRAVSSGAVAHIPDVRADPEYRTSLVRTVKYRSVVAVPMLRSGNPIGGIVVLRTAAKPFPEKQIELLKVFADQATIAIENTWLFQDIQASNRKLSDALAYQTATSEVLRLIASSPTELQPAVDMIALRARELCDGQFSGVFHYDGELVHLIGYHGLGPEEIEAYHQVHLRPPGRDTAIGRAITGRTTVHIRDVQVDPEYGVVELARATNMRCIVAVPMLRDELPVGSIVVWRSVPEPFSEKQIELLRTFADQAMIAMECVRLFRKVNRQLDVIRDVFGKYVPKEIAEEIVAGKGNLSPTEAIATILYSDLEAFTSIVEGLSPVQVVQMLNEYFGAVIQPINRHGGVINQFQGDAMLVTFNVPVEDPSHADAAIKAAREIQELVKNRRFAGVPLRTRIGINTGTVIAGNIGSGDRINYTVHGNAVNLAARIEQLNKNYDTHVLVSATTVSLLADSYPLKSIGEIAIRGKQEPVELFSLEI